MNHILPMSMAMLAMAIATHADLIPQKSLAFQGEDLRCVLVPFPKRDKTYGLVNKPFCKSSGSWITFNWHDTIKPALDSLRWKKSYADTHHSLSSSATPTEAAN